MDSMGSETEEFTVGFSWGMFWQIFTDSGSVTLRRES